MTGAAAAASSAFSLKELEPPATWPDGVKLKYAMQRLSIEPMVVRRRSRNQSESGHNQLRCGSQCARWQPAVGLPSLDPTRMALAAGLLTLEWTRIATRIGLAQHDLARMAARSGLAQRGVDASANAA